MAPPSKKRVQSSVKKESSKKEKSSKAIVLIKTPEQASEVQISTKKALVSSDSPTRKLFDHRFVKQDCFFSKAHKLKLEIVSSVAHTFGEPDTIDEAFSIPPEDTSKFRLMRMDYTPVPVLFRCPSRPSTEWKSWVNSELENLGVKDQLRSAGVLSALMSSTHLGIFRDIRGLRHVVRRWNKTTHTFVCSWGEFTPTLDDVSKLLRLPVMGDASPFSIELSDQEAEIESTLVEGLSRCRQLENKRQSSRPSFACWIRYFWGTMENNRFQPGAGYEKGCRVEALVCLWLCKFVFPELQGDVIQRHMFPLSIKLAKGVRFPLAPVFLGTFYKHLDMILEDEILAAGKYAIDTELAINFLQVFLWERIKKYAGEPASIKSVMYELGLNSDLPLWSRWFHMKQTKPSIWFFIDDIDNFTFRPYVGLDNEFTSSSTHGNETSSTSDIVKVPMCDSDGNWADLEYVVSIRPGLLPAWIGSDVYGVNYWPHRVLRQFGLDQGVPRPYSFSDEDVLSSPTFGVSRFVSSSLKSLPTIKNLMIQIAGNERQGLYTPKFVTYWKRTISEFNQFIKSPRSVCKAPPPISVPKRLKLDTREVRSFSTKIGMPFTVIDGTHREIVGAIRKWMKADDLEEDLPLIEAFSKSSPAEETEPSLDQQTLSDIPAKKRPGPKPKSATPKRKSARLLKKGLTSEDTVPKKNVGTDGDEVVPEESQFEEIGYASGGPVADALYELQLLEGEREPVSEEANKKLKSETVNSSEPKIATKSTKVAPENGKSGQKRSRTLAMEPHGNDYAVDQSIVLPLQTPPPLAKRPREDISGNDELNNGTMYREREAVTAIPGVNGEVAFNNGAKRREREAATAIPGVNGDVAAGSAIATTGETTTGDGCWQSKLNQFLGAFYGNSVAPRSIEEFLKLSGRTKNLNGITVPEESFQSMTEAIEKHGDIVANCWASKPVREIMFSRLSLVFYTLEQIPLNKLSEDILLALRDVVREATAVGFGVDFLLDHLRKLVSALFGRQIFFDKLSILDPQIENAQKEFDRARAKLEELKKTRSEIMSKASISTGTEGDCIRQALDFCSSLVHGL